MAIVDVKGLKPTGGTLMSCHAAYPDSAWECIFCWFVSTTGQVLVAPRCL